MVIRLRLKLNEEFLRLSDIYLKSGYEKYIQFVQGNVYFINLDSNETIDYVNLKLMLEQIFDYDNQKIFLPKLYEEYAYILVSLGEVEKSKEILIEVSDYLTEESLNYFEKEYNKAKDGN
ncbi:TPA: hypothetical protein U1C85_002322 [Streptococcus suis]|nr:hypothetical protein [Streptococcus suis]